MLARGLSLAYWLFVIASSAVLFCVAVVIWLLTLPFDRRLYLLHWFTSIWAGLYTWCNPLWTVEVRERKRIEPGRAYVMVANHLSLVDIFVLFRLFRHFKWVSKLENFRLPFIGWNMRLNRYIPLRRGDRDSVGEMFDACLRTLARGSSILMFPEGTRSLTGELKPFKTGAFELAKRANAAIVPILVRGTRDALPKKGFTISPARITVTVLPAIEPSTFAELSTQALTEMVHHVIADAERTAAERGKADAAR